MPGPHAPQPSPLPSPAAASSGISPLSSAALSEHKRQQLPKLEAIESAKRAAAYAAVDNHVKPHHKIIGIGSGQCLTFCPSESSKGKADECD